MRYLASLLLAFALPVTAQAAKPIAPRFNADPSPHYFETKEGGRFYVYATDDASNSGNSIRQVKLGK